MGRKPQKDSLESIPTIHDFRGENVSFREGRPLVLWLVSCEPSFIPPHKKLQQDPPLNLMVHVFAIDGRLDGQKA